MRVTTWISHPRLGFLWAALLAFGIIVGLRAWLSPDIKDWLNHQNEIIKLAIYAACFTAVYLVALIFVAKVFGPLHFANETERAQRRRVKQLKIHDRVCVSDRKGRDCGTVTSVASDGETFEITWDDGGRKSVLWYFDIDLIEPAMSEADEVLTGKRTRYVYFDVIEDVLASTDLMALVAPLIGETPSYWKWMLMGTHNALQGAMVCALTDSTGSSSVLTEKSGGQRLEWLQTLDSDPVKEPKIRLADFSVLLERCRTGTPTLKPMRLSESDLRDIERLHTDFRNSFAHFKPEGWSIEKVGLPRIVGAAMDATEWLMSQDRASRQMTEDQLRRLKANSQTVRLHIGNTQ